MKKSEVAELLTFIAAFDKRTLGPADVEAWSLLDVCKRYDLDTCKAAVVKFFSRPADDRGNTQYFEPQQLASTVREVRRDQRREVNRLRAVVLSDLSLALHEGGSSYEEIQEARRTLLRDEERMFEEGHSPAEVTAFLQSTLDQAKARAIESGEGA